MNHPQPHPSPALRSLPSARTLALMALWIQAPEPRADQRREDLEPVESNPNTGAGWYESSFELGRGLVVLEVLPGAGEWTFQAA